MNRMLLRIQLCKCHVGISPSMHGILCIRLSSCLQLRWCILDIKHGGNDSDSRHQNWGRTWQQTLTSHQLLLRSGHFRYSMMCTCMVLHFDTACPLTWTLALFGLASIPNPLGGLGSTATGHYGSNRIQAGTTLSCSLGLTATEDGGRFWNLWLFRALDTLLVNAFTDQMCGGVHSWL